MNQKCCRVTGFVTALVLTTGCASLTNDAYVPVDAQGKEVFLLAFSKSWEACKLQAQEQLHEIYGGAWIHGDDSHSSEDIADLDMVKLLNNGPMMKKLSQISA